MAQALSGGTGQGNQPNGNIVRRPGGPMGGRPQGGISCFNCGEEGHIAVHCPEPRRPPRHTVTQNPAKNPAEISELAKAQSETNKLLAQLVSARTDPPLKQEAPERIAPAGRLHSGPGHRRGGLAS